MVYFVYCLMDKQIPFFQTIPFYSFNQVFIIKSNLGIQKVPFLASWNALPSVSNVAIHKILMVLSKFYNHPLLSKDKSLVRAIL